MNNWFSLFIWLVLFGCGFFVGVVWIFWVDVDLLGGILLEELVEIFDFKVLEMDVMANLFFICEFVVFNGFNF